MRPTTQANDDDLEHVVESHPFQNHKQPKNPLTKLIQSIREKQNELLKPYFDIVLPPVILNTVANLETTLNDGSFETLLQLLVTQIDTVDRRNDTAEKQPFVGDLRKGAASYLKTPKKDREQLLINIKDKFVKLLNSIHYIPQKEKVSDAIRSKECNQIVQQLIAVGVKPLGDWCSRPEILEVDELFQELNSPNDSRNIAQPKTPLQNAKTHPSLTIMLKSIDRFEPFLKVILEKTGAFNERIQSDLDTPLHYAVRKQNGSFIEWLLQQESLDVNCRNRQMQTALFLLCEQYDNIRRKARDPKQKSAELKGCRSVILLLLKRGADFNICSSKVLLPFVILTQYSKPSDDDLIFFRQCEDEVQVQGGQILKICDNKFTNEGFQTMTVEMLEIFLRFKDLDMFDREFLKFEVKHDYASKVIMLLLHTAVEQNYEQSSILIVDRYEKVIFAVDGTTSHLKYRVELKGLLKKACESANLSVLKKLLCKMEKDKLLINDECILVYTLNLCAKLPDEGDRKSNLLQCAMLMASDKRIFHAKTDSYANTALHVALKHGFTDIAKALTENHRYMFLGVQNKKGETPLDYAPYEFCKDYFDQCAKQIKSGDVFIDLGGINPYVLEKSGDKFKAISKAQPKRGTYTRIAKSEMSCVKKLANSKTHKKLLHHPVIYTYILIKWLRFSMWHWINLILTVATTVAFAYFSIEHICKGNFSTTTYIVSWLGFAYVFGRELLQWTMFGKKYFYTVQNWMDMANVFGMVFVLGIHDAKLQGLISSLVVIIFAIQIIQLIGSLPFNTISTYRSMFRVVALNFVKSIALFCPLMLAFAYSFYLYYNDKFVPANINATDENMFNTFGSATAAGVKIMVMASGEFEAAEMNINGSVVLIFLLFIFCVPMVIQNLINGLAVSDIAEIRKESESISLSEKVFLLARVESGLNRNTNHKPIRKMLYYLRKFSPGMFFRHYHHVIKVTVHDKSKIMIDSRCSLKHRSKLNCLARQTKSTEVTENDVTSLQKDIVLEMIPLVSNGIAPSKTAPEKKQKQSKHSWEFIYRIPALKIFSPLARLDETVLEELLSITNRNEISDTRKPKSESNNK